MRYLAFAVLAMLSCTPIAAAQTPELQNIYDRPTLESWGQRYQRSTTRILDEVIWPHLLENERRDLGAKPVLQFPLFGEGHSHAYPLLFYHPYGQRSVVLPVFSLKLLDDLCIAYAWLQLKGYAIETVSEYTALLKFGKRPPDGFPPPLKALKIPENALSDSEIAELSLGHFVTSRTFLLLHEIGHFFRDYAPKSFEESVRNEAAADLFAARVMQRTPLPPTGALVFFIADAHWSALPGDTSKTHPLTGARLTALAGNVDSSTLAAKLRELGKIIDDPELRLALVATGKAGDLEALGPRRPGELPRHLSAPSPEAAGQPFHGVYRGQMVQFLDPEPRPIEATFERRDDRVTGRYTFGLGFGAITNGQIVGQQLRFHWEWAGNYGQGVLQAQPDGSFSGTWGYREASSGAGTWTARRAGR
jgi:hypothetical protein